MALALSIKIFFGKIAGTSSCIEQAFCSRKSSSVYIWAHYWLVLASIILTQIFQARSHRSTNYWCITSGWYLWAGLCDANHNYEALHCSFQYKSNILCCLFQFTVNYIHMWFYLCMNIINILMILQCSGWTLCLLLSMIIITFYNKLFKMAINHPLASYPGSLAEF